jgi:hypothetical protein
MPMDHGAGPVHPGQVATQGDQLAGVGPFGCSGRQNLTVTEGKGSGCDGVSHRL